MSQQQIEKTKAQNIEEPQYRDVIVTVDGLNVLDINLPGTGSWAPRFSVQLSGDRALDENGQRYVYSAAGGMLHTLLLGDNDLTNLVPHANISRENLDNDILQAKGLVEKAVNQLRDNPGDLSLYCHSLSITVATVDFDLIEKRILNDEAMDKVEFLLAESAEPSEALTTLMSGDTKPATTSLGTTTTIMINDELHVRRDFIDYHDNEVVVWVPDFLNQEISSYKDIPLGQVARHGDTSGKPTYIVVIRRKDIDGIPHERRFKFDHKTDDFFFVWIPAALLTEVLSKDIYVSDPHLVKLPDEDREVTYQWVASN